MSFLDQAKSMMGGQGGQRAAALLSGILQQHGGVSGLVDQLHRGGLGEVARSWVSSGQNLPVSPDQLRSALGDGMIAKVAASAGVDPQQAAEHLAKLLPSLVDKLTPTGQLPTAGAPPMSTSTPSVMNLISGLLNEGGAHA